MSSAATAYETIEVRRDGAVAIVELHRPEALNAVTMEMGREMADAFAAIAEDRTIRAVVLTGSGRAFSSGADLKGINADIPVLPSGRPDLGWLLREVYNPLILQMRELPQPIVAAVNGVAAGIGCSYALACDLVVAARSASFLLAFVNVALVPDGGASLLVPARAGIGRGAEMSLLGEKIPAEEALRWNLVNRVEEDDQALPVALEMAQKLAAGPPEAHAAIKSLLNAPLLAQLRDQLAREAEAQSGRSDSDEVVEAISAFLQKRPAAY